MTLVNVDHISIALLLKLIECFKLGTYESKDVRIIMSLKMNISTYLLNENYKCVNTKYQMCCLNKGKISERIKG